METDSNKNNDPKFLNSLIKNLRSQYANDPNIKHISWGLGKSEGRLNKGVCIIFTVHQKTSSERVLQLIGTSKIPDLIENIRTDVVESNPHKLSSAIGSRGSVIADPLNGGWTTSNADNHTVWFNNWGTIALLCTDNVTGDLLALSNWHVWADGGEEGDTIIQPGIPRAQDVVEGTTKVLACGPFITSLIEWETPDPLASGLYGAAAAAGIAAALSDYRDPSRRGQDATIPGADEKTSLEKIVVEADFKDLPIPGTAFKTDVKWNYSRHTNKGVYEYPISEEQINSQFLLGKLVRSNKLAYSPGENVSLQAVIWDYQKRPCDGYHVVAHLIADDNPSVSFPVVLHPGSCPKRIPWYPPDSELVKNICYDFGALAPGTKLPSTYHFDWLFCRNLDEKPLLISDWKLYEHENKEGGVIVGKHGLYFKHKPSSGIQITVACFNTIPLQIRSYDFLGNIIGTVHSSGRSGNVELIDIPGTGISRTRITGGAGEGVILKYCIDSEIEDEQSVRFSREIYDRLITTRVKFKDIQDLIAKANRCCFNGSFRIPPMQSKGRWNVYLTVQNINEVPQGTKPEIAAETIGGHLLAAPVAQIAGCAFIMLGDHVFDIF